MWTSAEAAYSCVWAHRSSPAGYAGANMNHVTSVNTFKHDAESSTSEFTIIRWTRVLGPSVTTVNQSWHANAALMLHIKHRAFAVNRKCAQVKLQAFFCGCVYLQVSISLHTRRKWDVLQSRGGKHCQKKGTHRLQPNYSGCVNQSWSLLTTKATKIRPSVC